MIGLKTKQKRFSLFYLQENELYTKDLTGKCFYQDPYSGDQREEKGKLHICSRSIVFEADQKSIPIYKFLYKNMKEVPKLNVNLRKGDTLLEAKNQLFDKKVNSDKIVFNIRSLIEIHPLAPYKNHDNLVMQIGIVPLFENIQNVLLWIQELYDTSLKMDPGFDPEIEINKMIMNKENKRKFDMSLLESVTERPLVQQQLFVRRVLPLITIHGILYVTNRNVYFQSFHIISAKPVKKIEIETITFIYRRRFELKSIGIEIIDERNKSYFFAFNNETEREEVYNQLLKKARNECVSEMSMEKILLKWQNREITNYEYLMHLNQAAYRSFSDLTQYPVFPWVIKDYESVILDLDNPDIYRDLSKPIGALNPKRLAEFRKRYLEMGNPKFLYGTHYSSPGYVIGYLVRKKPEYMLKLQGGRFDKPDRLFYSIKKDWENVYSNPANVKELIPEFYGEDDSFLVNIQKLNLGYRQNEKRVDDVKLPPWAKTPREFLKINRKALESDYVSQHLHDWIDLIFGYKQRGPQAVDSDNIFHHLTYEGTVDLESISDPVEKKALRVQINEFGQTPKQLFKIPHPSREARKAFVLKKEALNLAILNSEETSEEDKDSEEEEYKTSKKDEKKSSKSEAETQDKGSLMTSSEKRLSDAGKGKQDNHVITKVHKNQISCCLFLKQEDKVLTVGHDGFLKVIDIKERTIVKSFKVSDFTLCCCQQIGDSDLYALGSWNNTLYLYNLNYGNKSDSVEAHNDAISCLIYLKTKNAIFTGSWDCTIKMWKLKNNQIDKSYDDIFYDHESQITSLSVNNEETFLGFGDIEGQILVIDINRRSCISRFSIPGQKIVRVSFTKSNFIACGESKIKLFEVGGSEVSQYDSESYNGNITDFHLDGNHLLYCTDKGNVSIYNLLQEKITGFYYNEYKTRVDDIPHESYKFTCCRFNEQSTIGLFGSENGSLNILFLN